LADVRIVSVGAYDRFNYGDLLFPLVLDYVALSESAPKIDHVSVAQADMTSAGGVFTAASTGRKAVSITAQEGQRLAVILGGGEVLGATWGQAASSLLPHPADLMLLGVNKFISPALFDMIGKAGLRGKWPTPYVPSRELAESSVLVTNAIGASSLGSLNVKLRQAVVDALSEAAFVSVRDLTGQAALAAEGVASTLAPDSVAILRRLRPPVQVENEGSVVFQCSRAWLRPRVGEVVAQLAELSKSHARIQLLPIGLAGAHADDQALAAIAAAAAQAGISNVELVDVTHVWDVADTIAKADVFIGSSLHGHITSMAYGVPSVGLAGISKLGAYLDTWGGALTPFSVDERSIVEAAKTATQVDRSALLDRSQQLDALSWTNSLRVLAEATGETVPR